MNEWIKDELAELDQSDAEKRNQATRLVLIERHASRVFDELRLLIQDAVQQINTEEKLRKKTGSLECQSVYTDRIVVNKQTYPAIYLTVSYGPHSIDIHRTVVTNGANRQSRELRESLDIELDDNGHPFLKNKEGVSMVIEEAVRYIFRPFLHPEILDAGFSFTPGRPF